MNKVTGYIVSTIGLVILIFGAGGFQIPLIGDMSPMIFNILGMGCIIVGVILIIINSDKKSKGKTKDLPVYQGDEIVAYRRNK